MSTRPIICIVGRPNVGKSTLFNRIARRRVAIVEDVPGVTRDRNYFDVNWGRDHRFTLVDTGGFSSEPETDMDRAIVEQTRLAIDEADRIIFLVDARDGIVPEDEAVMELLRQRSADVWLVANKADSERLEAAASDFYRLGPERFFAISAAHDLGVEELLDDICETLEPWTEPEDVDGDGPLRIAIVGKPNVGKSSLVNAICGEQRSVAAAQGGTTRDTTHTLVEHQGRSYLLLDTAGIRRRKKASSESLERYSVMRSLRAIKDAQVVVLVIDGAEGLTDQDLRVASQAWEIGRPVIIAVNKWDLVDKDHRTYRQYELDIADRFGFSARPRMLFISAMTGQRVRKIFDAADELAQLAQLRISTSELNRLLEQVTSRHQPPMGPGGRRVKFYYGTQIATYPTRVVLFCNAPDAVHFSYQRYLINAIRDRYHLYNVPIVLKFRKRGEQGLEGSTDDE